MQEGDEIEKIGKMITLFFFRDGQVGKPEVEI